MRRALPLLLAVLIAVAIAADSASAVEVIVSDYTDSSITLDWTRYPSDGFRQYEIQWDKGHGWRILDIVLDQNTTEYEVENLIVGEVYEYRIWVLHFNDTVDELQYEKSNVVTAAPVPLIDGPAVEPFLFGPYVPEYVVFLILILLMSVAINLVLAFRLWGIKRERE